MKVQLKHVQYNPLMANNYFKHRNNRNLTKNETYGNAAELWYYRFCKMLLLCCHKMCLLVKVLRILPATRSSSGVMVAHLMPTLNFLMASAESMVT